MSVRTSTKGGAGAREGARSERRKRGRRRGDEPAATPSDGSEALVALEAELVLLRDENARLKAARHQEPDLGALLGRARSLPHAGAGAEDRADEAAQLLVEGMVLRESLLTVCRELAHAMGGPEARLLALAATTDAGKAD